MKVWSTTVADKKFSQWIRERDGKCLRCGAKENLSCSHFWPRNKSATRYDPDNCISLCLWKCHIYGWEVSKQGEYRDFMMKRLGKARYEALRKKYYQSKMTRREAILQCMELLK